MNKQDGHCFWPLADGINRCNATSSCQLCGFYFCYNHMDDALEKGASFWIRLYNDMWGIHENS